MDALNISSVRASLIHTPSLDPEQQNQDESTKKYFSSNSYISH